MRSQTQSPPVQYPVRVTIPSSRCERPTTSPEVEQGVSRRFVNSQAVQKGTGRGVASPPGRCVFRNWQKGSSAAIQTQTGFDFGSAGITGELQTLGTFGRDGGRGGQAGGRQAKVSTRVPEGHGKFSMLVIVVALLCGYRSRLKCTLHRRITYGVVRTESDFFCRLVP